MEYDDIMKSDEGVYMWLEKLNLFGICMVKKVPTELNTIEKVLGRITYIRPTMYGKLFDVISVPNAINIAYTNSHLDLHADLCYYETPPGLQFLHCLKNDAVGGENLFADGFKAAEILRSTKPESFSLLSQLLNTYHKEGKDHHLIYRRPVIATNEFDNVIGIHYSPPFLGTLHVPFKYVEQYYQAFKDFTLV